MNSTKPFAMLLVMQAALAVVVAAPGEEPSKKSAVEVYLQRNDDAGGP